MRGLSAYVLIHFVAITFAPGWIMADFLLERNRIARELCVQRMVPEDLRTCHGECQLSKRLAALDDQERKLPEMINAFRIDNMIADGGSPELAAPEEEAEPAWPQTADGTLQGHVLTMVPVPWG
ncbi:MAG TPA: hypothetical protein PKD45_12315 [Flavobacteriales bacterium]|nr:hypothetical protein [Flavobacteriales bacterium]